MKLDLVQFGLTEENFERAKKRCDDLFTKIQSLKSYKDIGMKPFLSLIAEWKEADTAILAFSIMYSYNNEHPVVLKAKDYSIEISKIKDEVLIKDLLSNEDINNVVSACKELNLEWLGGFLVEEKKALKWVLTEEQLEKLQPISEKQNKLGQESSKKNNPGKSNWGKMLSENRDKSVPELFKMWEKEFKRVRDFNISMYEWNLEKEVENNILDNEAEAIVQDKNFYERFLEKDNLCVPYEQGASIWKDFKDIRDRYLNFSSKIEKQLLEKDEPGEYLDFHLSKLEPYNDAEKVMEILYEEMKTMSPELAEFMKEKTFAPGRSDLDFAATKARGMAFTILDEEGRAYVSCNYDGSLQWQMTVAHEWGHALQLEYSKTKLHDMNWQLINIEVPAIPFEYIYIHGLLKRTTDIDEKFCILESILDSSFSRFWGSSKSIERSFVLDAMEVDGVISDEDYIKYAMQKRKETEELHKKYDLKLPTFWDPENKRFLGRYSRSIQLFQYTPGQAAAISNYFRFTNGEDVSHIWKDQLEYVDIPTEFKNKYNIDINKWDGYKAVKPYLNSLLDEMEKLLPKLSPLDR